MRPIARVGVMKQQDFAVDAGDAGDAAVRIAFWGGRLRVRPQPGSRVVDLRTRDNVDEIDAHVDARRERAHLDVRAWLESEHNMVNFTSWDEDDASSDVRHDESDRIVNDWSLDLGGALPLALDFDLATCDADLELGGLPIDVLRLDLGGGRARVAFHRPNPRRIDRVELDVGAGRLEASQLGFAHARTIAVDAGAGSCLLDLSGDWREDALIHVESGACDVEIRVPRDLALKADLGDSVLASLSAPDFDSAGEKRYTSPAWGKGGPSIVLEVVASLGSVSLVLE